MPPAPHEPDAPREGVPTPPRRGGAIWEPAVIVLVAAVLAVAEIWPVWGHAHSPALDAGEAALLVLVVAAALRWGARRRRARRAVHGASHDLLNAMTVIRGHVELLGRRGPVSADEVDGVRDIVIDELARMEGQVVDLGDA